MAVCMILAMAYEFNSYFDASLNVYIKKNKILVISLAIVMICFSGVRVTYNDTATYVRSYNELIVSNDIFSGISWALGDNPGFQVVNVILKWFGFSSQSFLMIYSIVTIGLYVWFVYKYSRFFAMSIFILLTGGLYLFSFAAIKQCVAIAISLLGIDQGLKKNWIKFVFWILIAATFHTYALMFLIVPFIMFKPWNIRTYILILAGGLSGIAFQSLLGKVLSVTSLLGENYEASALLEGEGVNIFRLAVVWAPIILSFLVRNQIRESEDEASNLFLNLSIVNAMFMFVARFGTAFYITRLANYFSIFQVITIPWLLRFFTKQSQICLMIIIYIGFSGFAYYAYGINRAFDVMYTSIPLWDYIRTLF